jgi:hypothetical protein
MRLRSFTLMAVLLTVGEGQEVGADPGGPRPLRHLALHELEAILPAGTKLLMHPAAIEQFLRDLDGHPPDWKAVYGDGHHDPEHDDRLFALNRERDARREGRPALSQPVTFLWTGTLSRYDPTIGAFPVAIGPKFIKTDWGVVRFKPEDAPGNLSVTTDASHESEFLRLLEQNHLLEIDVVMTGTLIPQESIVYDFSHDEEGLGLIMPLVRVEQVDCVMVRSPDPMK